MKYLKIKIALILIIIYTLPIINGIFFKQKSDMTINVYDTKNKKILCLKESEYITGVVAAEMPAEFEIEALKAQAVACRTYLYSKQKCDKHPDCNICTDSTHCQAYISKNDLKSKWGNDYDKYISKITDAIETTKGKIIYYNGTPIKAVYHSTSSGKTENAKDIWGGDIAYLNSVESPFDKDSPKYFSEEYIKLSDFNNKIKNYLSDVSFNAEIIGDIKRTEAGTVLSIEIYNKKLKGNEIRNIFNLNSSNFEITSDGDTIYFKVYGYGHGVGMSQYGANFYAKKGYDYTEILYHYYRGTEIK